MFKVRDIVKVKEGTPDPDLEGLTISGWQGTICEVQEPKSTDSKTLYFIKWDNKTLNEMPDEYLEHCGKKGLDHLEMGLYFEDLELAKSRPDEPLIDRYIPPFLDEDDLEIVEILGTEDIQVTEENLEKYQNYLLENLDLNTVVTGIEDFPWEERYIFGYGDNDEYKRLKKTRPSYRDLYKIMKFEMIDESYGLIVKVKRLSDRKFFELPLADLKANDNKSEAFQLLNDYSVWFVNWR
jgi:hypothetical protein